MEEESFENVLKIQKEFQDKCFPLLKTQSYEDLMLMTTRALAHEVVEVENEFNWKHWKAAKGLDQDKINSEIVDCFIFVMNMINVSGLDSNTFLGMVLDKVDININRQLSGY